MHTFKLAWRADRFVPLRLSLSATRGLVRRVAHGTRTLVMLWARRMQQRRELASMDARMRRDIGVDRLEVGRETRKPFWMG